MGAEIKGSDGTKPTTHTPAPRGEMKGFQFGAPKDYNHLSKKTRQDMTDKMMAHWKGWAQLKTPMG